MFIVDLFGQDRIPLSYEIFPPKGDLSVEQARPVLSQLAQLQPAFVSVTHSAGGSGNGQNTSLIAQMGMQDFGITTMAHLTCMGATRESIEEQIVAMRNRGIRNVLALRGDPVAGKEASDYKLAKDLIPQLREDGFCVGAAAYPEGHANCLDLDANAKYTKQKQDAGAEFFVTQLFFDNNVAYDFLDRCRAKRVKAPITFGIMPFMSKSQVQRMVFMCGASLPARVVKMLQMWEDDEASLRKAGIEYACEQLIDLAEHGVDGVHLYTMNKPEVAREITEAVSPYL